MINISRRKLHYSQRLDEKRRSQRSSIIFRKVKGQGPFSIVQKSLESSALPKILGRKHL